MSDRLAEIEKRAREDLDVGLWIAYPNERRRQTMYDVLALVEVAKAARVLVRERDHPDDWARLAAALSALDGEA